MLAVGVLASLALPALGQREIYPGVWKVRLGSPERQTPLSFRSAPPSASLANQKEAKLPFGLERIGFKKLGDGCVVDFPLVESEKIYGLGLNTKLFELSGRRAWAIPSDNPEALTNESHAPDTFYVSSLGYGIYLDTARYASYYIGNAYGKASSRSVVADIPGVAGIDAYVFAGPTALDAVRRYNLFSGGGCVPPLWGLGIAYRGESNFSAARALDLARSFRAAKLPCDIFGVEPGWQTQTYSSSFVWNRGNFPDPDAFIREMHSLGFHLSFWEHPFTHPSSPMYQKLIPYSGNFKVWGGLVPDFATDGGRRVYLERQNEVLFSKGVDSVKIDEIDNQPFRGDPWSFPDVSQFPSGLDGEQMHSLFGILAQQALVKPFVDKNLRTWGLARNSHALAAPLPYTIYSDTYDANDYVRGLAKMGFGGHLWVPEVRDATSVDDLIRRIQTVIFSPYAMINCWYMATPPWRQIDKDLSQKGIEMPEADETTKRVRKIFELRMSLIPYLYSAFNKYRIDGTPVIRPLVLDFPNELETSLVDDQFMFGPSLMVAPLIGKETHREIYFPKGVWFDFFTGKKIEGGRKMMVSKSLDEIPLYVKENSLLPLATPTDHVSADTVFDIHVNVYGPNPGAFTLYEDDGITLDYERNSQNQIELRWNSQGEVKKSGNYKGNRYHLQEWVKQF